MTNLTILYGIITLLAVIILVLIFINNRNKVNSKQLTNPNLNESEKFLITQFSTANGILEYFYEKAYFIIYQRHILAYMSSNYSIDEKANEQFNREFINVLFEIMGNNYLNLFIKIYGDVDTLINNALIYFNDQLVNKDLKIAMEDVIYSKNNEE